jgi:hypothetical protein
MFKRTLATVTLAIVLGFSVIAFISGTAETTAAKLTSHTGVAHAATMWKGSCTVCNRNRFITSQKRPTSKSCFAVKNGDRCKGTVIWQAK